MASPFDMRAWELARFPQLKGSHFWQDLLKTSHKFLIGNAVWQDCWEFGNSLITNRQFALPFDKIILECVEPINPSRRIVYCCFNASHGTITAVPFLRLDDNNWVGGFDYYLDLDQTCQPKPRWGFKDTWVSPSAPEVLRDQAQLNSDVVTAIVALLGVKNLRSELVEVPRAVAKKRALSGRPPLFEYRVVDLDQATYNRVDHGGTHATPALHWRRGHFRQLSDKLVPVAPCLVGSIENGFVWKDYDGRKLNTTKSKQGVLT